MTRLSHFLVSPYIPIRTVGGFPRSDNSPKRFFIFIVVSFGTIGHKKRMHMYHKHFSSLLSFTAVGEKTEGLNTSFVADQSN